MDALARIESRILDVQSRFARFGGYAATPIVTSSAGSTTAVESTSASGLSFRDISAGVTGTSSSAFDALSTAPRLTTRAPGTYGPVVLPPELTGQKNGRLSDTTLESIGQGDHRLTRSAAVAFRRMVAAAEKDGVTLRVGESYRTLDDQVRMAGTVGLYHEGGLAAVPGTSNHGWGLSVDIELDDRSQRWLRANATRFGFAEDVAREPWHYTYRPADV